VRYGGLRDLSRHYFESPTVRPDRDAQAGFSTGIVLYCAVDVDPRRSDLRQLDVFVGLPIN